jgi:hypothetical protein
MRKRMQRGEVPMEVAAKCFNLRQLCEFFAGFKIVLGTPELIADEL